MLVFVEAPVETNNEYWGHSINVQTPPPVIQPGMQYPHKGIHPSNYGIPLVHPGVPYVNVAPQYVNPGAPYAPYVHLVVQYAQAANLRG